MLVGVFCIYAVSSSTDLNHKCSIGEPNLFFSFCVIEK